MRSEVRYAIDGLVAGLVVNGVDVTVGSACAPCSPRPFEHHRYCVRDLDPIEAEAR